MQPYFFPYIGYLQLLAHVDVFVLHDDVQYVKQGWINRNRILESGRPAYITLPVVAGRHRQLICEKQLHEPRRNQRHLLARLANAYRSAPRVDEIVEFLRPLFVGRDETIASFNTRALRALEDLLGLRDRLVVASGRDYPCCSTAQERVIRICRDEGGSRYVNPIGARALGLYDPDAFAAAGLELAFLRRSDDIRYEQGTSTFAPDLSVLDVLMFTGPEGVRELLDRFVVEPSQPGLRAT